jgi:FkbM family methyltransferase
VSIQKLLRLPNYVKRFGLIEGLSLSARIGRPAGSDRDGARPVRLRALPDPIWLRPTVSDHSIFWQCWVNNQYDLNNFPQTEALLKRATAMVSQGKKPLIIDGGANIGLATRWFAHHFPFAHILAVEPDDENVRVLMQNQRSIAAAVTPVHGAISSKSGYCRITRRERGSAGFITEACSADEAGSVPSYGIDALKAQIQNGELWIVKLDIEGAQSELFSQNTDWIDQTDLIILELDDWQFPWSASSQTFFTAIARRKFDFLIDGELILCFRHTSD